MHAGMHAFLPKRIATYIKLTGAQLQSRLSLKQNYHASHRHSLLSIICLHMKQKILIEDELSCFHLEDYVCDTKETLEISKWNINQRSQTIL